MTVRIAFAGILALPSRSVLAGPSFTTDDPVPVEHRHWEVYMASQHTETADGWSGTAPHIEVNYGPVTNLQLHIIMPLWYDASRNDPANTVTATLSWASSSDSWRKRPGTPSFKHHQTPKQPKRKERNQMKFGLIIATSILAAIATGCMTHRPEAMGNINQKLDMASFYMPNAEAARIVTVTTSGPARANILVQTHAVSVKENAPPEALKQFGEVYSFSPAFFAVHRDEPTLIRFWNLQPDDNHDFMLIDPHSRVLMSQLLPPLKETSFVFTFHEEGLFNMICAMHQPSMNAQILVLPPAAP